LFFFPASLKLIRDVYSMILHPISKQLAGKVAISERMKGKTVTQQIDHSYSTDNATTRVTCMFSWRIKMRVRRKAA